jgi:hypothetical protein
MSTRREKIFNAVSDLVGRFVYYDRKEDEELPRGSVEAALANGEITVTEIVNAFDKELRRGLGQQQRSGHIDFAKLDAWLRGLPIWHGND